MFMYYQQYLIVLIELMYLTVLPTNSTTLNPSPPPPTVYAHKLVNQSFNTLQKSFLIFQKILCFLLCFMCFDNIHFEKFLIT